MGVERNYQDYNWSEHEGPLTAVRNSHPRIEIDDETLRDGLQGTQLQNHPNTEQKKLYLAAVSHAQFIDHADIGFPSSDEKHFEELLEIATFVKDSNLPISLSAAGRGSAREDVSSIVSLSHKMDGFPLEADLFLDVSEYRAKVQGWNREEMIGNLKENIQLLKKHNLPVMFVPERSTSTSPNELYEVCRMVADLGVDRICIADTKGVANRKSTENIFRWAFEEIGNTYPDIKWDFHEHNDRGMGVANCLTAVEEGVDRVHATMFCIGERTGNVDLHQLILNLNLEGYRNDNLEKSTMVADVASRLLNHKIPDNVPVIGNNAFSTTSGVHSAALNKEIENQKDPNLYFILPPERFGSKARVEVGPMSGLSTVKIKLGELGLPYNEEVALRVLEMAKKGSGILSAEMIREIALQFEE